MVTIILRTATESHSTQSRNDCNICSVVTTRLMPLTTLRTRRTWCKSSRGHCGRSFTRISWPAEKRRPASCAAGRLKAPWAHITGKSDRRICVLTQSCRRQESWTHPRSRVMQWKQRYCTSSVHWHRSWGRYGKFLTPSHPAALHFYFRLLSLFS